jgi:hypothetical protein
MIKLLIPLWLIIRLLIPLWPDKSDRDSSMADDPHLWVMISICLFMPIPKWVNFLASSMGHCLDYTGNFFYEFINSKFR